MGFPDLEEVFSAEEILAFWGEVGEGASSGAEAGSSSGAGRARLSARRLSRGREGRGGREERLRAGAGAARRCLRAA